ncbi:MAG: hypothetical protein ACK44E_08540, partial [Anaerolineales bacterium]
MSHVILSIRKRNRTFMLRGLGWLWDFALFTLVAACALPVPADIPTPYPSEVIPTLIAQTVQAQRTEQALRQPTELPQPIAPETSLGELSNNPAPPSPTPLPTRTPRPEQLIPVAVTPPGQTTFANAPIQIKRPGPYSKVVSPISLQAYLKPG